MKQFITVIQANIVLILEILFKPIGPFKLASEKMVIDPNAYGLKVEEY
jgi:hypothetical protein